MKKLEDVKIGDILIVQLHLGALDGTECRIIVTDLNEDGGFRFVVHPEDKILLEANKTDSHEA